jgi:hypothetical protein
MTDRAQPGAISSLLRNDELAQALDSFTTGGIVSGSNPTDSSIRRSDIDETVLDAFSLTSSASSLDVTIAPGEAFVGGWLCRDTSTTLTLPANATADIVIGHATDAIFDPNVDPDRDAADEVIVDLAGNVPADIPQVVAHRVETDGSGVTSASRVATVGGFSEVDAGSVQADTVSATDTETTNLIVNGTATGIATLGDVQTEADLPPIDPPQIAFVQEKREYQRSLTALTFDLGSATLQRSISTQDSQPRGITFNNDGTRLYEIGDDQNLIYESSLTTPFDISTATFQQSISSQDSTPREITFNNDGTRLYESGTNSSLIYESSLTTPFDISTANFQQSISSQDSAPQGITFNDDGTRLYEAGNNQTLIFESSLTTPFDISTATFQQSISSQDSTPSGLAFSNDGTQLFEIGFGSNLIYESSLSTPFDISTASFRQSISSQSGTPTGFTFSGDGIKLFEIDFNGDIFEITVGKPAEFKAL